MTHAESWSIHYMMTVLQIKDSFLRSVITSIPQLFNFCLMFWCCACTYKSCTLHFSPLACWRASQIAWYVISTSTSLQAVKQVQYQSVAVIHHATMQYNTTVLKVHFVARCVWWMKGIDRAVHKAISIVLLWLQTVHYIYGLWIFIQISIIISLYHNIKNYNL